MCEDTKNKGDLEFGSPAVTSVEDNPRCMPNNQVLSKGAFTRLETSVTPSTTTNLAASSYLQQMAGQVARHFGAYITSFRPQDEDKWRKRRDALARQLTAWMNNADVPLHLRLSGWSQIDIDAFEADYKGLLEQVKESGGSYKAAPEALLIHNRIACLKAFYASDYDWGVMMDDDAVLYDKAQHNSAWSLFPEMAKNGLAAYAAVDIFFPNNPGKPGGGFNAKYAKDPELYMRNHVFERNADLKGSMFIVRNFRKAKRHEVLPDPSYTIHGEDTLFATEAIKQGCTVMKCWNINLKELINERDSHFAKDRVSKMIEAHKRIAEMYAGEGLRMKHPNDPESKTLERRDFYENCWKTKPKKWTCPKP